MRTPLRRPHRLALATVPPRVFAFCHTFGLTVWIAVAEGRTALILPGLLLLAWPGIAYLHASLVQNSKQAEFRNLLFDCLLFGVWCSVLDFYVLATLTIGLSCLMNNMVVGGLRRMTLALLLFLGGAAGWSLVTGLTFRPWVSTGLDIYQSVGAIIYLLAFAYVMHGQNRQIGRSMAKIQFQNRVFQTLLELSHVANQASNIPGLLEDSLKHIHTMFPECGFAFFLQERQRPEVTRYAATAGYRLEADEERHLVDLLSRFHAQQEAPVQFNKLHDGEQQYIASMAGRLSQYEGWLIVRSPRLDDALEQALTLLVDQLASAVENKSLHLTLRESAERDALTGLYNRGFLESALATCIQSKLQPPGLDFAVLLLDLDGLKEVNDQHGHTAGDQLIAAVAERLTALSRESDILARYGGDEFVLLFPSANRSAADRMTKSIRTQLDGASCRLALADGEELTLTLRLSLGGASSCETAAHKVLDLADERMYADKALRREARPST